MNTAPAAPPPPGSFLSPVPARFVPTPQQEAIMLRAQLDRALPELEQLRGIMAKLASDPACRATVVEVGDKTGIVIGSTMYEVHTPTHLKIQVGSRVNVDAKTNQITAVLRDPVVTGAIREVTKVIDAKSCEIKADEVTRFVVVYGGKAPEPGDRVVLDSSGSVVLRNLGKPPKEQGSRVELAVTWEDIGGLADVKEAFIEAIESPLADRELHARYRKERAKGALVCGPPGCGKTMLAKAAAAAQARIYGKDAVSTGFIYAKGPELLQPLVGNSEAGVRKLFEDARAHFAEHGYPAIICLDEADSLLARRGMSRLDGMEKTIVPMFLAEMDGMDDPEAAPFVMVLTNRPDTLDPAITRKGRLDLKLFVRRPTQAEAHQTIALHLKGRPLNGMTLDEAAAAGVTEIFDDRRSLYMIRTHSGNDRRFTLGRIVSGAMCSDLVEKAATLAIRREKAGGSVGITRDDIAKAADWIVRDELILEHPADIQLFADELGRDFRAHEKVSH